MQPEPKAAENMEFSLGHKRICRGHFSEEDQIGGEPELNTDRKANSQTEIAGILAIYSKAYIHRDHISVTEIYFEWYLISEVKRIILTLEGTESYGKMHPAEFQWQSRGRTRHDTDSNAADIWKYENDHY